MTPIPAPGLAFVKRIETVETYAGGSVIIPEQARDRVSESQWEIVSVGAPEICDDDDCERAHFWRLRDRDAITNVPHPESDAEHPCDLQPGDWVLVRKRAAMNTPMPDLFVIKQSDCLGRFVDTDAAA